jgi:hypothetical protein
MDNIVLRLLLHGLIVLVPNGSHLTALLVDGTAPPAEASKCVGVHTPKLQFMFAPGQGDRCDKLSGCKSNGNVCTCTYNLKQQQPRYQFSFVAAVNPSTQVINSQPAHHVPSVPAEAADPAYVFDLQNLTIQSSTMQLDNNFLSGALQGLLWRMEIPFTRLTACNLSLRQHGDAYYVHSVNFHRIGAGYDPTQPTQAVGAALVADADVPHGGVKLVVEDLGGGGKQDFDLVPNENAKDCPNGQHCVEVLLANARPDDVSSGDTCDQPGIGWDFPFYYNVTTWKNVAWIDRVVPTVYSETELEDNVLLPLCKDHFASHVEDASQTQSGATFTKGRSEAATHAAGRGSLESKLLVPTSRPICTMAIIPASVSQ